MCGRYSLGSSSDALRDLFGLEHTPTSIPTSILAPRYNIAPGQLVLSVRQRADGSRPADMLRWGLIPSWAKDARIGYKLINARSETVTVKPAFRRAFRQRRCLVPADGFFEWAVPAAAPAEAGPTSAKPRKQPWYFHLPQRTPFALAALWERWQDPQGQAVDSCTLLTTRANAEVAPVHHRMPVILQPEDYAAWLEYGNHDLQQLQSLLRPLPDGRLNAYAVSTWVNRAGNDDPQCIAPWPQGLDFNE